MNVLLLDEHRCKCGKLLFKGMLFDGSIEIKCKRCDRLNKIDSIKLPTDNRHYLLLMDSNGKIINASDSGCKILGYSRDELIGKLFTTVDPLMPPETGKRFIGPDSSLNEDNYFQLDTVHQSKDGKIVPITAYLKLYKPTKTDRNVLLLAELKDAPRKNKLQKDEVQKFDEYACDFYFDLDENGMGEYVSPSVKKLFGFAPEAVIGKNYFDYLPMDTREKSKSLYKKFSAEKQPFRITHETGVDNNGNHISNELYFTPKFNDLGKFTGYRVLGWTKKV